VRVPAVPATVVADPTGVGDAFRAGFLAGVHWGLSLERSAQVGCLLATHVLETVGTQEYRLDRHAAVERFGAVYGEQAAAEVAAHLTAAVGA
jgi:adenosine kinase